MALVYVCVSEPGLALHLGLTMCWGCEGSLCRSPGAGETKLLCALCIGLAASPTRAHRWLRGHCTWKPGEDQADFPGRPTFRQVLKTGCSSPGISQGERSKSSAPTQGDLHDKPLGLRGRRGSHVALYRCLVPHWVSGPACWLGVGGS